MLEWAYMRNIPLDHYTFAAATKAGNNDIIKWLVDRNCNINPSAWSYVAARGT